MPFLPSKKPRFRTTVSVIILCLSMPISAQEPAVDSGNASPSEQSVEDAENLQTRARALSENGQFAEAATLFDQEFERTANLAVLLRAGLAWYQGGFFSAAQQRFVQWKGLVATLDETDNPGLVQQKTAVDTLYKKASSKVFRVSVTLPEDAYRQRTQPIEVSVSRLEDGFVPAAKTWKVQDTADKRTHEVILEAGRWLFEIRSPIYEEQPEVVEIYDDSPLSLSPIPSGYMPAKDAPTDERMAYREALDQFRAGGYAAALKTIRELVPSGLVTEEALWLKARSMEGAQRWYQARRTYLRLLELHPKSPEADMIRSKLDALAQKAEATKAKIDFKTSPPNGVVTIQQDTKRIQVTGVRSVYPGPLDVEIVWASGVRQTRTIMVQPNEPQTFEFSSVEAFDAISAEKWRVSFQMSTGFAFVSGNQSETVDLVPGPVLNAGFDVGWDWSERLRFETGLIYAQTRPGFDVATINGIDANSGTWVFHHISVPVAATWVSQYHTEFTGGLTFDTLLYGSESGAEDVNISRDLSAMNGSIALKVRQPLPFLGKGFAAHLFYARQLMPVTSTETTLRLQHVGLGLSTRIL